MAVNRPLPGEVRAPELSLLGDNGCQPTSVALMEACSALGMRPACTSDHHPTGNADTERVMRTLQEEGVGLHEGTSPLARLQALERWLVHDNAHERHSALGCMAPRPFERGCHPSPGPPFVAA
jgi:putative transposase